MDKYLRVKVQARVLRTIDKVGGLDEYLMGESPARVRELGMEGWKMRWRLMKTEWGQQRLKERRIELGLRPEGVEMMLNDAILLGDEEQQGETEGDEEGKGKKVELRFKEDDVGGEDEYEDVHFTDEERHRILEADPRTRGGRLPWEPASPEPADKPRKSLLQRLIGR